MTQNGLKGSLYFIFFIRYLRNENGTGAELGPAIVSGIVTWDALISYWPIFSLSLVTVSVVFAKANSSQFPLVSKVVIERK